VVSAEVEEQDEVAIYSAAVLDQSVCASPLGPSCLSSPGSDVRREISLVMSALWNVTRSETPFSDLPFVLPGNF